MKKNVLQGSNSGYLQRYDGTSGWKQSGVGHPINVGTAAILPVMKDGRIVMVRQYRNALERETLGIPAGCRDSKDGRYGVLMHGDGRAGYACFRCEEVFLILRTTVAFCDEAVDIL